MEQQEQEGTKFMDVKQKDRRTKYIGPVIAAAVITVLMCAYIALIVWVALGDSDAPRWLAVFSVLPVIVIGGVLLALYQRVKQIKGGEEDAAAQY
jgi:O-antigen/teichoic acid export membrane protein